MDDEPTFGHLLKRYRRAGHLTQAALAEHAGYSSHYVSMLERGVRLPQPFTIDVLADALALREVDRAALHTAITPCPPAALSAQPVAPPPLPLLGREHDVDRVVSVLRANDARLLSLTGPGGVGKTSLARQVAATLAPTFRHGTAFVDLAAVTDADEVVPTIARALAVREMARQPIRERLYAFLREREALLLLDSFERVVAGSAAVGQLLAHCPHLTLLVTSRVPLRLEAEHEFRVQPLALPDTDEPQPGSDLIQSPALALFVRRAMLVKPDIALGDEQLALIADICRRVDGLPLAIELAATRVSHLPLAALRDRLQHRLHILTGGARDLPARQQRMRDAIAWSYDLLAPNDQALLRRLSVFTGSWSLEAAEEVCIAEERENAASVLSVLDSTRALVEGSLITAADDSPDEPRYRMLDTIREYAAEELIAAGELDLLRRRHSAYYVRLAEQAEPALQEREQRVWYPRLEREHDNLRAALDWLLRVGETELALRLGGAVWRFWQRHGDIREGRWWLETGLTAAETKGQHVAEHVHARALWGASWLAYHQGDYARSRALSVKHLALARQHNDALGIRNALTGIGMTALAEGNYAEAVQALQEALDICKPLGNTWHRATSYLNLGNASMLAGELSRAETLFAEALALYQERGDAVFTARSHQHLGYIRLLRGDYAQAGILFAQSLRAFSDLGEQPGIADGLEAVAAVGAATGQPLEAGRLLEAASMLRERIGIAPLAYLRAIWQPWIVRAEEQIGADHWTAARLEGRALSLEAAVARAVDAQP